LKEKSQILNLRFQKYIADNTAKRLNTLIPVAILLLILLVFSDIYIRHSIPATYTRIIPISLAAFLYLYNKFQPKISIKKVVLYNIFLVSIPAMMFAKYLIHHGTETNTTNILSIIVAILIISLEVRANIVYSLLIFLFLLLFSLLLYICFIRFQKKNYYL